MTLACTDARASSIILLAPVAPEDVRSVVELGEPLVIAAPPDRTIRTSSFGRSAGLPAVPSSEAFAAAWSPPRSPSFISFGTPLPPEPRPAVPGPAVAAGPSAPPMVIRGGLAGEAFPAEPAAIPVAPVEPAPAVEPAPGFDPAAASGASGERPSRREMRREERRQPAPVPETPAAPPTGVPL